MQTPIAYDSGLYHFGSIRWLNEEAIVPGLGNLHWRLALNQSYFGFLALLNIAPYWNKGYAAGGLFLLVLAAFTLFERLCRSQSVIGGVQAGLFLFYFFQIAGGLANPSPDFAVIIVQVVIYLNLLDYFSKQILSNEERRRRKTLLIVLCFVLVFSIFWRPIAKSRQNFY